jgi:hypothetical protein
VASSFNIETFPSITVEKTWMSFQACIKQAPTQPNFMIDLMALELVLAVLELTQYRVAYHSRLVRVELVIFNMNYP